ncbi:MAG: DsrH/TusB family sulfur metabolism protein [Candidatus Bathyarchaeia archaeon]|jgi:sulfur relay protein TusB/DsrH
MVRLFIIRDCEASRLRLAESIEGAAVALLQDGVYLATSPIKINDVYILTPDAEKRGVKEKLLKRVKLLGYEELVTLLLECGNTVINL